MAPYVPPSTPGNVKVLLQKIDDADPDIRYMTLNDLFSILRNASPLFMSSDQRVEEETVEKTLRKLDDQNGDVQNQAIKCLGVLAPNLTPQGQVSLLGKLTSFTTTNSIDNTMRTTGMRTILSSFEIAESQGQLPASTQTAYGSVSKTLIPYLIDNAMKQAPAAFDNSVIDIIVDLVRVFGPRISEMEKNSIQKSLLQIIHNESMAMATRKKAINALSTLATQLPDRLLGPLVSKSIEAVRRTDCPPSRRRLLITLFGSLVRSVPHRIVPQAKSIIPLILNMLSEEAYQGSLEQLAETGSPDEEVEELFEAALAAMEGFIVSSCKEISPFVDSTIDAALRFLRYDPNVTDDGNDDTEMVDTQNDDNHEDDADGFDAEDEQGYEEEGNQSDDDDSSWKVRRCAIKILQAIIGTRRSIDFVESGVLYQNVAPNLIKRFSEREETVRIEIVGTLAQLVRQSKASQYHGQNGTAMVERRPTLPTRSRKRRRDSNGLDISTSQGPGPIEPGINSPALSPSPSSGPQAELVYLIPKITQAAQNTLKQDQPASKLAATSLLKDLVLIQPGALTDTLSQLIESLAESLQASGAPTHMSSLSTNANAGGSLRMETLRLLAVVCDNHSSKVIATNIESVVLSVASAAKDRMTRVAVEAIRTLESITRAFTPPRSAGIEQSHHQSINNIFDTIIDLARKADADLEVRQQAIIALGVVVARASSQGNAKMLGPGKESSAFAVIAERLRNETTRLAAIQAIDALAGSLNKFEEIQNTWVENILIELLGQLRKADRLLRDSSLLAIKSIALNKELFDRLNESTANFLTQALLPLINADDLNSLGTALTIYARIAIFDALVIANDSVVQQVSALIRRSLSLPTLDALAALLKAIGEKGSGQAFMNSFLQQGIRGDITVSGRAIATLLVYGGRSIEVTVDDFAKELGNADESRVCLALSILGEAGLLFGSSPPATLQPKLFMKYLKSRSDQVTRAAAVALGRAGVGNKSSYLPAILQLAKDTNDMKYLALHAIRELLTSANRYEVELSALADSIWDALMAASSPEDNQVLGAECLGRLALVDPTTYLPKLQTLLQDDRTDGRSIAIQAIRFTFSHHGESLDEVLRSRIVQMLVTMFNDQDLVNRRLGLGALNSAAQHKSNFVLPQISTLLPLVIRESRPRPDLVREVQMGPFKHKVDDGLELRKSAYETLYTFMERDYRRLNGTDLYDRVIAGLGDDHEIKVLCNLMVMKLINLDPGETVRRLDQIADQYRAILSVKLKDNSVKQEYEKDEDIKKGTQKVSIMLKNTFPELTTNAADIEIQGQNWRSYWGWLMRDFKNQMQVIEAELYQQGNL